MNQDLSAGAKLRFAKQLGIRYPVIGGAMYPCSNPELTAAVSRLVVLEYYSQSR